MTEQSLNVRVLEWRGGGGGMLCRGRVKCVSVQLRVRAAGGAGTVFSVLDA
jgi:hypothetical protein